MVKKSIIGAGDSAEIKLLDMNTDKTHKTNCEFWDTIGSEFLGVTALPLYGAFVSEEKLHFLDNIEGSKVLEIGCGNGHSLEYAAKKNAAELYGIDLAPMLIKRTEEYLSQKGINARLYCSPMEEDCGIPKDYFDFVYSVYAIGWTTDLDKTFKLIASYLKKDGTFIFSWSHPIHKCVSMQNDKLIFSNSYFDESWYSVNLGGKKITLSNRKLSTYINALAKAGFIIEQLIEESDKDILKGIEKMISLIKQKCCQLPLLLRQESCKLSCL